VADPNQTIKNRDEQSVDRDEYAPPMLKEFGPVGVLTQAGSTGANEAAPLPDADMR
jgi:hypothetical protein